MYAIRSYYEIFEPLRFERAPHEVESAAHIGHAADSRDGGHFPVAEMSGENE